MMTNLYPIGTQLYTTDLETAAGYVKRFDEKNIESYIKVPAQFTDSTCAVAAYWKWEWAPGFRPQAEKHRITVTPENQELLSPVPMVGDLIEDDNFKYGLVYNIQAEHDGLFCDFKGEAMSYRCKLIEKRTYNDQRLPFLGGWDEVREPEAEGL